MPRKRRVLTVGEWIELVSLIPPELLASSPPLQRAHAQLRETLDEVQKVVVERDFHQAEKQAATARLRELLKSGGRTANVVRVTLREHLGPGSEQLAAFKMQPFRGRKRAKKQSEPSGGSGQ